MLQGTGSDVGKSLLVAGLCRLAVRRGLRVMPFKPQNMSNNAAVTADGGEIGRAQALQARAARVETTVHMNPVLLKPETDQGAQVIVQGRMRGHARARAFQDLKSELLGAVLDSFSRVRERADLVIVEGAGSPAETNLRAGDIANMGFAAAVGAPVVLVGDIDRGGVIASLVGTRAVISEDDAAFVDGFIINKFRGDRSLFDDGLKDIARLTGWRSFGVVPWFADAGCLPAEDAVGLERRGTTGFSGPHIAVPLLSRIANFDDLDPLRMEPSVTLSLVRPGEPLPADVDLVVLPGTKSTIGDLAFLRAQGWDIDIKAHVRRGGQVIGVCGGYQMLGQSVSDPGGVEGPAGRAEGLGLLNVETVLASGKAVTHVTGRDRRHGEIITGYEIHVGRTDGPDCARPFADIHLPHDGVRPEGACSGDGRIAGCYLHGLFNADGYRRALLARFGEPVTDSVTYDADIDRILDDLADHLDRNLEIDRLFAVAR